ncbi:MAG: hypothetical protein U9N35_05395 [Euryarchaeota archaeon]|nr:hypothetical protein [Euryarchaeota archaeon]
MKKILTLFVVLAVLTVGCINEEETTPETTAKPETPPGPPEVTETPKTEAPTTAAPTTTAPTTEAPEAGKKLGDVFEPMYKNKMWSAYTMTSEGEKMDMTMKFFDDGDIYISEMEMTDQGMNIVVQVWYTKEGETLCEGEQVKTVMRMGGITYCISAASQQYTQQYSQAQYDPEEYDSYSIVRETTYTTPSGKSVKVLVVKDGKNEWWFSNEIPFSIVKVITEENETLVLKDFGSDAKRTVSRKEGENCVPMQQPTETP